MNYRNLRQAEKLYEIYKNNARLNYSIDFLSQQVLNASITLKCNFGTIQRVKKCILSRKSAKVEWFNDIISCNTYL